MKKTDGRKQKTDASAMENGLQQVEAYLDAVLEPAQTTLRQLRAALRSAVPVEATEAMSYGMPAFSLSVGRKQVRLAGYAAFKKHCGYFPMSSTVMTVLQEELKGFSSSKGGFQFPLGQPLRVTLVKKLVKARLAEIELKVRR